MHFSSDVAELVVNIVGKIAWPIVVLILGLVVFLSMRERIGEAIDRIRKFGARGFVGEFDAHTSEPTPTDEQQSFAEVAAPEQPESARVSDNPPLEIPSDPKQMTLLLIEAFTDKDFERADALFVEWRAGYHSPEDTERLDVFYQYMRFERLGDRKALANLEELARKARGALAPHFLAKSYLHVRDFVHARQWFEVAIEREEPALRMMLVDGLVECRIQLGEEVEALALLATELQQAKDPATLAQVYRTTAKLAEHLDDDMLRAAALESVVGTEPGDWRALVTAGIAVANANLTALSILNYETALALDSKNQVALNNLGVAYNRSQMPIKGVETLREAIAEGSTLASANLGLTLLQAGLANEAREVLNEANRRDRPHENVARRIADLAEQLQGEDRKREELKVIGGRQQLFLAEFVQARLVPASERIFAGQWQYERGEVEIAVDAGEVTTTLLGYPKLKLTGPVFNRTAALRVQESTSFLGPENWTNAGSASAVVDSDGTRIRVLLHDKESRMIELLRTEEV